MSELENTWASRDLPILVESLRLFDTGAGLADRGDLERETGLSVKEIWAGLRALSTAQPPFLEVDGGVVVAVTERARRELGTWPSAESLVDALAAAFAEAAEREKEPVAKGRLRTVADGLGGALREIAIGVITKKVGDL